MSIDYKKKTNSIYPEIDWQYVVMEGTEDAYQINTAKKMAKELNIPIWFKLTWDGNYKPKNKIELKELTGLDSVTRKEFKNATGCDYNLFNKCSQLWSFPQINWDGRFLACCCNRNPFDLNVFDLGKMV